VTLTNLTGVGVLSSNGVVYLSGTVAAPESRQKAETLAGGVGGVRRVVNMLVIGPEPQAHGAELGTASSRRTSQSAERSGTVPLSGSTTAVSISAL